MKKILLICILAAAAVNLAALDITLEAYVQLVEKNSKQLMAAAKELEIAIATEKAARSQTLPLIGAEAGYARNLLEIKQPVPVAANPSNHYALIYQDMVVNKDNEFTFGLGLNQQIFNLKVFNAIKASKQYKLMSGYIYDAQRQAIITIAKKVYYQNYLLEQLLEVRKNLESNTYENYLNAKNKFTTGIISEFDFLRAEVEWKTKIPETLQAQRNLDLARINLKNLAGIDEKEEIILKTSINEYPDIPKLIPVSDIFADRPDYKATAAEVSLREINLKAARSDHFPTLKGNILFAVSASSDQFALDNNIKMAQVGITVSVPVFTGGALLAQDRKAKSEYEQSVIRLDQLKDDVAASLSSIYLTLKEAQQRIVSAEATVETAKKAYNIAQTSY
ncbi:MAG: TolC family protein, partial [Spirochaetaceae bacterium]|nr:TolC family protein [Spirochaetaceae bacterium]